MFHNMVDHKNMFIDFIGILLTTLFFEYLWNKKSPYYKILKETKCDKIGYTCEIGLSLCGWIMVGIVIHSIVCVFIH